MNLIAITAANIGGDTVQTVNARELHEFLEVGKDFSSWAKAQIERARLVDGRDFVTHEVFPAKGENQRGGRPRTEYHITIEAAKHIGMMSGTDKGFEVREYFIECEKRAKSANPAPAISSFPEAERLVFMRDSRLITDSQANRAALRLIGLEDEPVRETAAKPAKAVFHVSDAAPGFRTVEQLASMRGVTNGGMNGLLSRHGYQERDDLGRYAITSKGANYGCLVRGKILWHDSVLSNF